MKEIVLVSGNADKVTEVKDILKVELELAEIELVEIQGELEEIAQKKAEDAFERVGKPVIVDDVGLYIDALNGVPGPYVKDFLKKLGNKRLLELLRNEQNRMVTVKSAVGYHDGTEVHVFVGEVKGTLAYEERGSDGWGFDPIIVPEGQNQTYAEMGSSVKNTVSHRRRAFDKLKIYLDSQK